VCIKREVAKIKIYTFSLYGLTTIAGDVIRFMVCHNWKIVSKKISGQRHNGIIMSVNYILHVWNLVPNYAWLSP